MKTLHSLAILAVPLFVFWGCSSKSDESSKEKDTELQAKAEILKAEVEDYYRTKVALPIEVQDQLENGEVTREEIDQRAAAGEFPKFFQFKNLEDLPADLAWEDGSDLPEIGSPKAIKGGTSYGTVQDFPRTLRTIGPDSNGSFRTLLLDDVAVLIAHRHPNIDEIGPNGFRYIAGLAKEWAIDKGSQTVYVRIDPKARWSDGEPITSDDFLFKFFFMHSSYIKAPWYNNFYNRFFSGITKYDDLTFSVRVSVDKPNFATYVLEDIPIPEHFYGELGDDFPERYQWRFAPTTAAYNLKDEDIRKGESLTFTRLEDWWAKDKRNFRYRYNYDKRHIRVVRDVAKSFEMFKKGELDAASLTLAEYWYDKLPDDDPLVGKGLVKKAVFYNQRPRPPYAMWINRDKPLLNDRNIRLGIQYASNWQLVIDKYFRGDYQRLNHTAIGYGPFTHPGIKAREFSVDKALEHFAKAGFTERGPDGILVNEAGAKLSVSLTTGYTTLKDALTIIKEEAAKAGLEFRLQIMDNTAGFKLAMEKQHEIHFMAWGYGAEMYPRYWETFHSVNAYNPDGSIKTQTNNLNSMNMSELDDLIDGYRASIDSNEMIKMAHRMEEIIHNDASVVPAFQIPFYRIGYWRWRHYPDDFNLMISESSSEFALSWMDVEEKRRTLRALRSDETFEKSIKVYDQYKN